MKAALSQRLVYLRKERGYTQKQAAAKLNISQALLSHYEKGIRECGLEFLCNCAQLYDVTTDYLLGRSCEKHRCASPKPSYDPNNSSGCAQRQMLVRAAGMLFDLYHQLGNEELLSEFSLYMSIPIYTMTRYLYEAGNNIPGFFSIPFACFPYATMSRQLISEMNIKNILSNETWPLSQHSSVEGKALPKIDHTSLSETFPNDYAALLRVLHFVDTNSQKKENNQGNK